MLRTTSPNISVITNFGCRAKCWYCIWKGHHLENVSFETDWTKLTAFLVDNEEKGKVSVSGGGDCLYKYAKYKPWWDRFLEITRVLNMQVDVHTRERFENDKFWRNINRCVFSSDKLLDDIIYLTYLVKHTKIRITHLVTADTTDGMIEQYLTFQDKHNCQFTIKELIGFDDKGRYKEIREKYPDIFHLDEGDYNIYYMPDNNITDTFLEKDVK